MELAFLSRLKEQARYSKQLSFGRISRGGSQPAGLEPSSANQKRRGERGKEFQVSGIKLWLVSAHFIREEKYINVLKWARGES